MKVDFDKGQQTEIDSIFGYPLKLIKEAGLSAPRFEFLYRQLRFREDTRQ
jgi:ketopantoate reductase